MRQVAVVGQGYVGLPLAVRAAECGDQVVGFDVDEQRISGLLGGNSHVEDVDNERLSSAVASGRYVPTSDPAALSGFEIAVVTVPTPLRDGRPDLSHVEAATRSLAPHLTRGACVILESTTYPGTTEQLVGPLLERESGLVPGKEFDLGYSPERIDPGNEEWPFERIPKVVSGVNDTSRRRVEAFYRPLIDRPVPVSSPRVAELTKLLENTFRHVNIALVNELAIFAAELEIDIWEVVEAAATKPFGYLPFRPGPGVGGHCLPIDPTYLSWQVRNQLGHSFRFVELANEINNYMPHYVVQRVSRALTARRQPLLGAQILILGLAYKPDTGDVRESPAIQVAHLFAEAGATVRAADPQVPDAFQDPVIARVSATREEVEAASAVVLLVDHTEFDYSLITEHATYVFDAKRRLPKHDNIEFL
ncbi:MAG TPA: nucleotide sugar dehydrogenase [Mycobacteriales bacterium]|nr:nucleotide sugar dehydrogenase [Mycobacteriales bacterium]